MSTADDDDPTRALDGFADRAGKARPEPGLPDLSDLLGKLQPGAPARTAQPGMPVRGMQSAAPARAKGGTLRSGERWEAEDVVDVPHIKVPRSKPADEVVIDLPVVQAPLQVDVEALDAALRQASDHVATQLGAADEHVDWQPSSALAPRRERDPRWLAAWKPGAWTAASRLVLESATEFVNTPDGPAVETYAAHRLLALWPPQRLDAPLLGRWPAQVLLSAAPEAEIGDGLLRLLPAEAELWLAEQDIDWALVAEIVLHHEPALRPFQLEGLRRFVEAEREASYARLNAGYAQAAPQGPVARKA